MKKTGLSGVLLLIILISFQSVSAEQAANVTPQENPFNGSWVDDLYTVYIQQQGTDIQGYYEPFDPDAYDPGRLIGTLSEDKRVFSGKWTESGVSTLKISGDEMSFSGTGENDHIEGLSEPEPYEYNATRAGKIQDPENIWTGEWTTPRKTYTFTQNGSVISGVNHPQPDIEDESGIMEGTVSNDGKTITINWTETGDFFYRLSDDGMYINGTYSVDLETSNETLYWNLTKVQ